MTEKIFATREDKIVFALFMIGLFLICMELINVFEQTQQALDTCHNVTEYGVNDFTVCPPFNFNWSIR